jgi:hypothetical protein
MTKKSKPLSPEQFQQLLIATANLPFIHLERPETDFILHVLETPINLQMRAEVVVKALEHFRQNVQVQHGIHTFDDLQTALARYPDTEAGNKEAAQWLWNNQHWTRVELLRRFMAFLQRHDLTDLDKLTSWAHQADFERDWKDQTKGMGMAAFNWLLLRLGVQTLKTDVWVLNFGERILGKRIPDEKLLNALMDIAPLAGVTPIDLDRTLWHHERMNMAEDDVPALRVVWWRLFQEALQQRLNANGHNDEGGNEDENENAEPDSPGNGADSASHREWQLVLDDPALLRYKEAGLTLIPHVFWVSCQPTQATHIRVLQSEWHLGFGLWMEVRTDKALTAECFATVSLALETEGWALENHPRFVATLDLDFDLFMSPDTMMDDLREWAQDLAEAVTEAVEYLHTVLHQHWPTTIKGYQALPKFLLVDGDAPPSRKGASNDGSFKTATDWDAEVVASGGMALDEFLGWLVDRIADAMRMTKSDRSEVRGSSS